MTDPRVEAVARKALIHEIIMMYHTTRLSAEFEDHILSKPSVQKSFAAYDTALSAIEAQGDAAPQGDFVLVPREPTEAMLDVLHDTVRILVDATARTADIQNDRELWAALLAAAPQPAADRDERAGGAR